MVSSLSGSILTRRDPHLEEAINISGQTLALARKQETGHFDTYLTKGLAMGLTERLAAAVGADYVLTGDACTSYTTDVTKRYISDPIAVVCPGSTEEVSAVITIAHQTGTPVVPVSGNTGLAGGTYASGALMLSLARMNRIREIRPDARIAVVEAGVILSSLHEACEAHDLVFPLTFGARGSALVGGALSTNAGGSNVVRYGSTRGLCLGLEVVLADGRIMDLMTELHKDNTGYDLRNLFIGAEGTLGIITGAVLRLFPRPKAYATAMVATGNLSEALTLLNRLQAATGGGVEAFEYMPRAYIERHITHINGARAPFGRQYDVNIMLEIGATAPRDAEHANDGSIPVVNELELELAHAMDEGLVLDAVVARTEAQRNEMWKRREDAAEIILGRLPMVDSDVAVPTDRVPEFFEEMDKVLADVDSDAETMAVAHLGDGNIHHVVFPTSSDPADIDVIREKVEAVVRSLRGSFSAEHGIGLAKLPSMRRRKDAVAIEVMHAVKSALDPKGILNPGKVVPELQP